MTGGDEMMRIQKGTTLNLKNNKGVRKVEGRNMSRKGGKEPKE